MFNRIIRIAAMLLGSTLLLGGCVRWLDSDPVPEEEPISFSAGSTLLRDDAPLATKSGTIKNTFDQASDNGVPNADYFFVWGKKTVSGVPSSVFTGDKVVLKNLGSNTNDPMDDIWTYTNSRFWDMGASYYDFLAFSGTPLSAISCNSESGGSLTATVTYDPTVNQCDILAAFYQRAKGNAEAISTATVHMPFQHVLSAVRVTIYNDTPGNLSTPDITLNAYTFRNIVTNSTGTFSQDGNGLAELTTTTWSSEAHNGLITGVLGDSSGPHVITPSSHYPTTEIWDLMIPQDLEPFGNFTPQLYLDYVYTHINPYTLIEEEVHTPFGINLEQIHVKNSDSFITSWEPGKKYTYEIHIRLGGGVNVTVNVTDWEEVIAETPGVIITQ